MNHSEIVSFLWGVADLIRDTFKRGKYQDVILPLTVLRRLDAVLAPTKQKVLEVNGKLKSKLENLDPQLRKASGFAFYNTSLYDFDKLLGDAAGLAANLRNYINGFSPNMREVIEKFDFDNTISKLDEAGLLFQVVERFKNADLHPDRLDNAAMGSVFEELIRKFNEALDENPGEHFTPRDVVHLMADCLLTGDESRLAKPNTVLTVYDPCCGTGGMLTIAKQHIRGNGHKGINPKAGLHVFGQESQPETYAVCKSDLYIKDPSGRDADNILFGSTLSNPQHRTRTFDYLIANPPYGKDWKRDQAAVEEEYARGDRGRFGAGLPRISDGQLLFLQHMLAQMKAPKDGGSRVAIIMNGSPLFTGDAGSGESEIRRWILENDWLEALIALPEQLFYNTGIATYVWVLSNRKAKERKGKVALINATDFWTSMRKNLGDKRREIPADKRAEIVRLLNEFTEGDRVRIYPTTHFAYRKITVERPLRLNFQATPERIARLDEEAAFRKLAESSKKSPKEKAAEEAEGRKLQDQIRAALPLCHPERSEGSRPFKNRDAFVKAFRTALDAAGLKVKEPVRRAILSALAERDETADICLDADGSPEPDPELRDYENVPWGENVTAYFEREVKPYVPDAWINESVRDEKDGQIGKVGYEINFNRYFYKYVPPRPLEAIEADIKAVEQDILRLLKEVTA
jgi:type I restriction enzyme M protein